MKLIGEGSWSNGKTDVSVLEIGEHSLRNIIISGYLRNYLVPGEQANILVSKGFTQGIITRQFIASLKTNGKKYAQPVAQLFLMFLVKWLFTTMIFIGIGFLTGAILLHVMLSVTMAIYYIKECIDFLKF